MGEAKQSKIEIETADEDEEGHRSDDSWPSDVEIEFDADNERQ